MSVSNKDIEEAKRRVREMQSRANAFASGDFSNKSNNSANVKKENQKQQCAPEQRKQRSAFDKNESQTDNEIADDEKENQTFIILLLLLILSHEGADGKLLLALLYLLM